MISKHASNRRGEKCSIQNVINTLCVSLPRRRYSCHLRLLLFMPPYCLLTVILPFPGFLISMDWLLFGFYQLEVLKGDRREGV